MRPRISGSPFLFAAAGLVRERIVLSGDLREIRRMDHGTLLAESSHNVSVQAASCSIPSAHLDGYSRSAIIPLDSSMPKWRNWQSHWIQGQRPQGYPGSNPGFGTTIR